MLEQLELSSYVKTSGSKGLQVWVPLNTEVTYEETRPFARAVAETLESKFTHRIVSPPTKGRRRGRVLVDWSKNDAEETTLCVYSLCAEKRPIVSTPLEWVEVEAALADENRDRLPFDHEAALHRVEQRGDLFAPVLSARQRLPG